MRRRLFFLLSGSILAVLTLGGVVYGANIVNTVGYRTYVDRFLDIGHLVAIAQVGGTEADLEVLEQTVRRHADVYGHGVYVLNRSGEVTIQAGGADGRVTAEVATAGARAFLTGQNTDFAGGPMPWDDNQLVLAAPIVRSADVSGAIVTVSDTQKARREILERWGTAALVCAVLVGAAVFVTHAVTRWVLLPVQRLSRAVHDLQSGAWDTRVDEVGGPPELRRLGAAFNTMAAELEAAFERETEFVANASHQLRNPLSALLLRVESVDVAAGDGRDVTEEIDGLRAEGWHMAALLDDLLRLARGDQHAEHVAHASVDDAVRYRLDVWRAKADVAGVRLVDRGIRPCQAWMDVTAFEGALDAVLDNAVKYAPARSDVEVTVVDGPDGVVTEIRDHGEGLDADELEHAAERFWRSERHLDVEGTGLGLAIARVSLESFGGRLVLVSPADGGLAVHLVLPVDRPAWSRVTPARSGAV